MLPTKIATCLPWSLVESGLHALEWSAMTQLPCGDWMCIPRRKCITTPKRQDKSMEIPKKCGYNVDIKNESSGMLVRSSARLPSISSILRWAAKKIVGVGWFVASNRQQEPFWTHVKIVKIHLRVFFGCETSLDCSYNGGTWAIPSQFCCRPRWPIWPWMLTRTRVKSRECAVSTFPV